MTKKLTGWDQRFKEQVSNPVHHTSLNNYFLRKSYKVLKKYFDADDKLVLEPGTGSGRMIFALAKDFPDSKFIALDNSDYSLKLCQAGKKVHKLKNVKFMKGNVFSMPFPDNHFDVVFNRGVIEHFTNYEDIIKEMARVSRKKVIVIVPNGLNIIQKAWYYLSTEVFNNYPYGFEYLFNYKQLTKAFRKAGLQNIMIDGFTPTYRLTKIFYGSYKNNLFFQSIQLVLKALAYIMDFLLIIPLDLITGRRISRYFGWGLLVKGEK